MASAGFSVKQLVVDYMSGPKMTCRARRLATCRARRLHALGIPNWQSSPSEPLGHSGPIWVLGNTGRNHVQGGLAPALETLWEQLRGSLLHTVPQQPPDTMLNRLDIINLPIIIYAL